MGKEITKKKNVLELEKGTDKQGECLYLTTQQEGEDSRKERVHDKAVMAYIKGTGVYEFSYEKVGQWWEMTKAVLLQGEQPKASPATPPAATADERATGVLKIQPTGPVLEKKEPQRNQDAEYRERAITAQVCVKAAADVTAAAVAAGAFKGSLGVETASIADFAQIMAENFMSAAGCFIGSNGKKTYTGNTVIGA